MKLNLGCGHDRKEGYINCDISLKVHPDKVVNLEKKLPFKKNSVDEIIAEHVFEHIVNFIPLMHEIYRVSKPGAIIKIKVPFYASWGQWNDPTHVRAFTPFTFNYFKQGNYSHEVGCDQEMFEVKKVKLNYGVGPSRFLNFLNPIINLNHRFYCRFFAWIFPAAEINLELKVKK